MHVAESERVYFEAPHRRPSGPHSLPKSGEFFQPITTPSPYQRSAADDEDDDVRDSAKDMHYLGSKFRVELIDSVACLLRFHQKAGSAY